MSLSYVALICICFFMVDYIRKEKYIHIIYINLFDIYWYQLFDIPTSSNANICFKPNKSHYVFMVLHKTSYMDGTVLCS